MIEDVTPADPLSGQVMDAATWSYTVASSAISIYADSLVNPEIVDGVTRTYRTVVYTCPDCSLAHYVDQFQISFSYLGINPGVDCPTTSILTPILDAGPFIYHLYGAATRINYVSSFDTIADSIALPSVCGP